MAAQVRLLALLLAAGACAGNRSSAVLAPPQDGVALLNRMRDAYLGKWFKTVTFVQQTIRTNPETNVTDTTTWYEALKSPDRLRIDFGSPKSGNGVVYTPDSVYVVRESKVVRSVPSGNPFLPFVQGVYDQPIDTTLRQIKAYNFDLTKIRTTTWEGRPTYVVGSQSAGDSTSTQFWVDQERLVVVRMVLALNPASTDVTDILLEDYRPVAGGWLAVRVEIKQGGKVVQRELYSNWHGNVNLSPDFFIAEKWNDVPHWATTP